MSIQLNPVDSSLASHVGHDASTQTLAVRHHDGSEYHYQPVSPRVYEDLMRAPSLGKFLHKHIRGHIPHTQVK